VTERTVLKLFSI